MGALFNSRVGFSMKNKFHLNKRPQGRFSHAAASGAVPAAALIDDRYLGWLLGQQNPKPDGVLERSSFNTVFCAMARALVPEAQWMRTCLYTDQQPIDLTDDVLLRMVPQHAADGGLGLVRALGLELTQLSVRGAVGIVLVASDDERLIPYIDEAQWRGLKVVLVTDEASQDHARLTQDDPSFARLLMQADRRMAFDMAAWKALTTVGSTYSLAPLANVVPTELSSQSVYAGAYAPPFTAGGVSGESAVGELSDDWRAQLETLIQDWWDDETHDARLDLHDEMINSQGVPSETDRHLLLRARRELGRTLSFTEKKLMRELIRQIVLAQPPSSDAEPGTQTDTESA